MLLVPVHQSQMLFVKVSQEVLPAKRSDRVECQEVKFLDHQAYVQL